MVPAKKPLTVPVDVSDVPIPACWMLSARGGWFTVSAVPSGAPFKYNCNFDPS